MGGQLAHHVVWKRTVTHFSLYVTPVNGSTPKLDET